MSTATVDEMLAGARAEVQEERQVTNELERETTMLLDGIREFIGRYVVLPSEEAATAIALFVLHTWALEAADATPYLVVVSAEKRSGKTRLLEVLELLIRSPWRTASTTEAALVRKISAEQPTLLLDEIDAVFGGATRTEALRGVLNAGNRRGNTITRCEGKGTQEFPTFCAKVLAGIDTGTLPDTITDRSVVVTMIRKDEEPVERLRARQAEMAAEPLRGALALWAGAAVSHLALAYPELPGELTDRAQDAWEPLLAIGELAGGVWSAKAYEAARVLSRAPEGEETNSRVPLLDAIRSAVGKPALGEAFA